MSLAHRDTHGVHLKDLAPGTDIVGVAPKNMGFKIRLLDGYKKRSDGKTQKVTGRFVVLDAGSGTYHNVCAEMIRMQDERKARGLPAECTFDDLALAAERLELDAKPTYVLEANCMFVADASLPTDTVARMAQYQAKLAKSQQSNYNSPSGKRARDEEDGEGEMVRSHSDEPTVTRKVEPENPRREWFLVEYPNYWKPPFSSHAAGGTRLTKMDWQYKLCERLVTGTISDDHRHRYGYSTLQINSVRRVENSDLWGDYYTLRSKIAARTSGPVLGVVTKQSHAPSNEYYLFHGLNGALVNTVINEGFDERVSNLRGMFGCGVYFAENSSKSDQYSHTADCKQVGAVYKGGTAVPCTCASSTASRYMLLCRVTLGDPHVLLAATSSSSEPLRRPPVNPKTSRPFDSILGESKSHNASASLAFREYIVFDRRQVYPEFIIEYSRVA
eukprot:PhM_4_TR1373/c0_g1_i1/m.103961/K10799/TNKS; tankyrase